MGRDAWPQRTSRPKARRKEGFLLFYDDIIAEMLHIKIWIDASLETCMERRHKRGKASRKKDVEVSKPWFRDLIWSHYEQYKTKQLNNAVGALRVDGELSKEELLSQCLPYCTKMIAARVQVLLRPQRSHKGSASNSERQASGRAPKRVRDDTRDSREPPRRRQNLRSRDSRDSWEPPAVIIFMMGPGAALYYFRPSVPWKRPVRLKHLLLSILGHNDAGRWAELGPPGASVALPDTAGATTLACQNIIEVDPGPELATTGYAGISECRFSQTAQCQENYLVLHLDLAANSSVRQFVTTFRSLNIPLDALVCNAAVYFPNAHKEGAFFPGLFPGGGPRWSADGHELSFATNYLGPIQMSSEMVTLWAFISPGHFLLCNLLLEDLKKSTVKPARCIILGTVTASINDKEALSCIKIRLAGFDRTTSFVKVGGMIPPVADLGDLKGLESGMQKPTTMIDNGRFNGAKAYKDSKVCDVMLMRELHKRHHASTGIAFSSLYPGCIADTNLFREHYPVFRFLFPILQREVTNACLCISSPCNDAFVLSNVCRYVSEEEAGRRLAKCVADPAYAQSGVYFSWGGESGTGGAGGTDAVENMDASNDRFLQYGSFRTLKESEIGGDAGDDARVPDVWQTSAKELFRIRPAPEHCSQPRSAMFDQQNASPGDAVTISGLRRRHELNGVRGEVLSSKQDEFGRIRVRIDAEGSRTMKIQPFRLVPDSLAPVCKEFDKVSLRSGCERATNSTAPSAVSGVSNTSSRLERRCLAKAASLPTI
eukprot:g25930.t1